MQPSDSQSSSSSSSSLSTTEKDAIGLFLVQKFIKGVECLRPSKMSNDSDTHFVHAQDVLDIHPTKFKGMSLDDQRTALSKGARALVKVLNPHYDMSKLPEFLDELSPKLEEVFRGQSETLRPFLDILIGKDVYNDPDLPSLNQIGIPMDMKAAKRAWTAKYQGTAHRILLQNIQTSFKKGVPYANSGSIIQSSGYGKSRTVDKMASLIPTIPMNVRFAREEEQGAFPPTDATLIQIFNDMKDSGKPLPRLFFFFKELFGLVQNLAQGFDPKDNFATNLHDHFNDQEKRAKFYTDLSEIMKNSRDGSAKEEAIASYKKLTKLLPKSKEPVKMVIYIDEVHTLSPQGTNGPSMYDYVLKATAELAYTKIFFVFLSTASRLEVLASQAMLSNSSRFRAATDDLVAPFTEMPFDCHPGLVEQRVQPGLKLEEIQKFSFAVRFGRPLFWAYYEAMRTGDDTDELQVDAWSATLDMAKGKLVSNATLSTPGDPGKLAILDTLLNLEYDPRRTHSHQLASTMVASHMRTVYSVPSSRAYMHTGYPSEPVLAEAALTFINRDYKPEVTDDEETTRLGPFVSLYRTLDVNLAGAIDNGERGENAGKMVLLLAYTAAVKNSSEQGLDPQFWGEGCSLVNFLTELTGEIYCRDVLASIPDNIDDGLPLEKRFEKSWVRFTHFARAADDSAMTSSVALGAFVRGMAMIGWDPQIAVNVNIPILLDKDKPITESNMSSILVQFNVRSAPTSEDKAAVDAEKIKYFPPPGSRRDVFADPNAPEDERKEYHTRPYISLVMELGLVATSGSGRIRRKVVNLLDDPGSKPPAPKDTPKPDLNVHPGSGAPVAARTCSKGDASSPHIHPRYSLFYYGCSHKVYRCIQETEEAACSALLQIPTAFNDGPSGRPVDPILQMKPFWSAGKNCYSWLDEPYLNQEDWQRELHDDQVLVGVPMYTDEGLDVMDESH